METFEKSTLIKCSVDELFDFHLNTDNLTKITPPNISVELLTPDIIPQEGEVLKIKSTKHYIPLNWEVKIDKLEKPHILVDIAIKSPFKYWEHQHIFIQHRNFTELKDVVKFELPFGMFGRALQFLVYNDLMNMFDYRHKITKEILESKDVV